MTRPTVDWLYQEVHDLLDVSHVGLYEFLEILNSPEQSLSRDQQLALAREALARFMAEPDTRLIKVRWPEFDSRGDVRLDQVGDQAWNRPDGNGDYVAIDRARAESGAGE
jgi:hypothetical protein